MKQKTILYSLFTIHLCNCYQKTVFQFIKMGRNSANSTVIEFYVVHSTILLEIQSMLVGKKRWVNLGY